MGLSYADPAAAMSAPGAQVVPQQVKAAETRLPRVVWLYLICIMMPFSFNIGPLLISPLRLMLLVATVPLLLKLFQGNYGKVLPVDYLFIAHIVWASAAIVVNNPGQAIENAGSTAIEFLGGYLVGRAYIRSWDTFVALIRALRLLVLLTLPIAIPEIITDQPIVLNLLNSIGISTVADVAYEPRMGMYRAQVVFAHPIHYGLFCSVALAFSIVGLRGFVSVAGRTVWAGLITAGVVFSVSSGALLAAMLQYGLIAWEILMRKVVGRWLILLALFVLMYIAIDILSNRTPIRVLMSYATFSAHTAYYRSIIIDWGLVNVWNSPFFGLGLKDWVRPHYMHSASVDNFWLVVAMRYGIPGFILITLGYIDAIYRVGRRKLQTGTVVSNLRLAWMITFVGLSFTLTTVHVWTSMYSYVFFLLGAGLWIATCPARDRRRWDCGAGGKGDVLVTRRW